MLTMELLIPEQWPRITPEPSWVTFLIPIRSICRSIPFQALSMTVSALDPYLWFWCSNALLWFLWFLRNPVVGAAAVMHHSWLWWCSAAQECVDPAEPLAQTAPPSDTDQLRCCSPSLSPDTQKCLFVTQAGIYTTAHMQATVLWSACQT